MSPARLGRRAAAYVIDAAIAVCIVLLVGGILGGITLATQGGLSWYVVVAVAYLVEVGWLLVFTWMQGGAGSIGMRALGLRLARETVGGPGAGLAADAGERIGFGRAFLRNVVWALGSMIVVGLFSPLFDSSPWRRGWHDRAAGAVMTDVAGRGVAGAPAAPAAAVAAASAAAPDVAGHRPDRPEMPGVDGQPRQQPGNPVARDAGGAAPGAVPGGPVPVSVPGSAVPVSAPGGAVPISAPGGAVPISAPGGSGSGSVVSGGAASALTTASFDDTVLPTRPPLPAPRTASPAPPAPPAPPAAPTDGVISFVPGVTHPGRPSESRPPERPVPTTIAPAAEPPAVAEFAPEPPPAPGPRRLGPRGDRDAIIDGVDQTRIATGERPLARLAWDNGARQAVYGRTLFGRNPVPETGAMVVPVRDETMSLSKTHFELVPGSDGDARVLWIVDRHSTNGVVVRRGIHREPLVPGERTRVRMGDVLEFGDRHVVIEVAP
ncbi:RDD family protein [Microbacterium sp.]|uniref:RDD family protein n=1 Tax=Microbacterium sp. TaxID=51671 RepID=UPI0039E63AA5